MLKKESMALITGASRGIGAAIAINLGKQGYHVLVNYQSNADSAQQVVEHIQNEGGSAELIQFNVSDSASVEKAFRKLEAINRPLEILINNAGICRDSLLLGLKDIDLYETIQTNLTGLIHVTKASVRLMLKNKKKPSSIVQISSLVGECGNAGQSVYAASKAGVIGFSKSLAKELARRNIRVNVITPGFIETDMTDKLSEAQKAAILQQIPLGFMGQPKDVAALVDFLVSDQSRFITGQIIGINGGQYM